VTISNVFAFDIETVPDVEFGRRLHGLEGLTDKQVGYVMQTRQREQTGSEFLSLEQHRVVAISVAMRTRDGFKAWSLGEPDSSEADLVRRLFDGIERQSPTLVSWNGSGFDLPVLHYRALRHCIQAHRYWEMGDEDPAFRWNNYLSRFHWRHVDLMDVLAGFQGRGRVGLDQMAQLLGLPGKLGMTGEGVWEAHLEGRSEEIRHYCESDAINTYLVYLRFELMRGRLTHDEHARECRLVRDWLGTAGEPHLARFLAAWPADVE
jgi:predicted PolB exonuclease-like 3'-5' exonuclease